LLTVLRAIERINLGRTARFSDDWKSALKNDLNKQNLRSYYQLSSSIQDDDQIELMVDARRKDHISHFLLRLAFCRTEESRRWFISQESDLFRFRFSEEKSETIQKFMQENQINFYPVSDFSGILKLIFRDCIIILLQNILDSRGREEKNSFEANEHFISPQ